ncbi:hypothetical protein K443DRAFT_687211 [Laccaria amethystina LaAM-08-1]|uniref:Uncharacterized protein n=1 Tax=Laccaria amethystina LaAM-08-1 TaxID=1095629 RepID=A0A0C9WWD4_9AGAR|nr:hypothetical protein K443DRAFT_687211 [Laccaria amethystina LaAM-08-1]
MSRQHRQQRIQRRIPGTAGIWAPSWGIYVMLPNMQIASGLLEAFAKQHVFHHKRLS